MSDCGQSMRLLQVLNDENQDTINDCLKHASVKQWINDKVNVKLITNPRIEFVDDFESTTCLCYACCFNTAGIVRQLVQAGADVTVTDSWQETPLYHACMGDVDVKEKVEFLLSRDTSQVKARNKYNNTPLHVTAINGNNAVISVLIQHGADVNARGQFGRTALHKACGQGHVLCIHEFMTHGADIEARDSDCESTPLQLAAYFNHSNCVKVLLEDYDASINATDKFGQTALHRAAAKGHVDVVRTLVSFKQCDARARDKYNDTPLHDAALSGNTDVISVLIQHGAEVNERGQIGRTALHVACSQGHVSCVQQLKALGANLEAKDSVIGSTPLHLACEFQHVSCILELIQLGAELDARDNDASTPLHAAVTSDYPVSIKALIDNYGASINATNKRGDTPLHLAAAAGYTDMVELLTSYSRCNLNITNKSNETPADAARRGGHTAIAEYLTPDNHEVNGKLTLRRGGRVVRASDFGSNGPGFDSHLRLP